MAVCLYGCLSVRLFVCTAVCLAVCLFARYLENKLTYRLEIEIHYSYGRGVRTTGGLFQLVLSLSLTEGSLAFTLPVTQFVAFDELRLMLLSLRRVRRLSQDNQIKQRRAWPLLGLVTAERSCPCKRPACPAIGVGSEVTFKPLVPRSPFFVFDIDQYVGLLGLLSSFYSIILSRDTPKIKSKKLSLQISYN
ncbi:hypothetical protein J6590_013347 [Homalodisca vitripennis]|nr:hypothetical protein J6590_013347 [Homalodisca vitripennis]